MSDNDNRRRWFRPVVAFGFLGTAIGILSGWNGAVAKLEELSPYGDYAAPFVGTVAFFLLGVAIFWIGAWAWQPLIRRREERRRIRTEEANEAAAKRTAMVATQDVKRLRLLEETKWLFDWVKVQVDGGGFRIGNPLETERASLLRERLVDEGLLDSWATVNLDVVSRQRVAELAKVVAHLEKFPIAEAVDRLRRS